MADSQISAVLSHRSRAIALGFCALSIGIYSGCVTAADYSAGGHFRQDASYDNNIQLSANRQSAFGHTSSASFDAAAETEQTSASLDSQILFRRFDVKGYDSDDQNFSGNISHSYERSTIGMRLSAVRDSTLTSELLDSGRTFNSDRHEQYSASPNWSYKFSESDLLTLQGSYATSHYAGVSYTDYRYWQTSLLWTHSINERLRGFAQASYSDYQSDPLPSAFGMSYASGSKSTGVQIGGDYQLSESFSASVLGGITESRANIQVNDPLSFCPNADFYALFFGFSSPLCTLKNSTSTSSTLDGSLSWSNARNDIKLDINRSTQPSSNGYEQLTNQLNFNWRYRLWEYGALGLTLTAGTTDVPNSKIASSTNAARNYEYATLSYTHSLTEEWLIDCNYQYRTQKYETTDRVESNVGFVGITWKPITQHWSR